MSTDKIDAKISCEGEVAELKLWRPLELALQIGSLDERGRRGVFEKLNEASIRTASEFLGKRERAPVTAKNKKLPLCVVTYANSSGGWFPYFYSYYSQLVGCKSIFVITPRPDLFSNYEIENVIALPNVEFDDVARAYLASHLVTGLQSYFDWVLTCDVDELVAPHPQSNKSFFETLDLTEGNIILTRGFDVLQGRSDSDFCFDQDIISQRRYAAANTAICKPLISRAPIRYSSGFHYCQDRLKFPPKNEGFVTYHLKWACKKVRNEVLRIVAGTTYSNKQTELYAVRSISNNEYHPLMRSSENLNLAVSISSPSMAEFERQYHNNLAFSPELGLWRGEHRTSAFLVDLHSRE